MVAPVASIIISTKMPSLNLPTRYASRRLPQTSLLAVPPAEVTDDSSVEINLFRSSSTISGLTINISSYLRFISYLQILVWLRDSAPLRRGQAPPPHKLL